MHSALEPTLKVVHWPEMDCRANFDRSGVDVEE